MRTQVQRRVDDDDHYVTKCLKSRRVPNHECVLPQEEDIVTEYIYQGSFVMARRALRRYLMVNPTNPMSKAVLKSTYQIRTEEIRHLRNHYYTIHPFSDGWAHWEMVMFLVILLQLTLTPFMLAEMTSLPALWRGIILVLACFTLVDVILTFFAGYFDENRQKVILDKKRIARGYLKGFFVMDLIAAIPKSMIIYYFMPPDTAYLAKFLLFFHLGRIPKMIRNMEKFCTRWGLWTLSMQIVCYMLNLLIFIMWATGAVSFLMISQVDNEVDDLVDDVVDTDVGRMLESCYQATMEFMLVRIHKIPEDNLDRGWEAACLFFGSIIDMIILAYILQVYNRHSRSADKYNNIMQQIEEYMKYKELPADLRDKIFRYMDFKFQKHIFREEDILNSLSPILKEEILLNNCQKMVERVDFFKDSPLVLIVRIVKALKKFIYLPNDVIVQAGTPGFGMYFIFMGTVAVYTPRGKEICHLHDGNHFGEISLLLTDVRVASVVAVNNCEVYRLSKKDFQEAVAPFPELCDKMRTLALSRLETTQRVIDFEEEGVSMPVASSESLFPGGNSPEDKSPEDNSPEDKSPEDNAPEDNFPEYNSPEEDSPEDNSPDASWR